MYARRQAQASALENAPSSLKWMVRKNQNRQLSHHLSHWTKSHKRAQDHRTSSGVPPAVSSSGSSLGNKQGKNSVSSSSRAAVPGGAGRSVKNEHASSSSSSAGARIGSGIAPPPYNSHEMVGSIYGFLKPTFMTPLELQFFLHKVIPFSFLFFLSFFFCFCFVLFVYFIYVFQKN